MQLRSQTDRRLTTGNLLTLSIGLACLLATSTVSADDEAAETSSGRSAAPYEEAYSESWEYDSYYIFPLTRHMSDSGLPTAGQYALYPFAFVIDLGSCPLGALAGLAGK
jgi:hypothetical protein